LDRKGRQLPASVIRGGLGRTRRAAQERRQVVGKTATGTRIATDRTLLRPRALTCGNFRTRLALATAAVANAGPRTTVVARRRLDGCGRLRLGGRMGHSVALNDLGLHRRYRARLGRCAGSSGFDTRFGSWLGSRLGRNGRHSIARWPAVLPPIAPTVTLARSRTAITVAAIVTIKRRIAIHRRPVATRPFGAGGHDIGGHHVSV
jgi:hypothetical protein